MYVLEDSFHDFHPLSSASRVCDMGCELRVGAVGVMEVWGFKKKTIHIRNMFVSHILGVHETADIACALPALWANKSVRRPHWCLCKKTIFVGGLSKKRCLPGQLDRVRK